MKNEVKNFLSNLPLFSSIPTSEIEKLSETIIIEEHPTNKLLLHQITSEVKNLYIIREGEIELYFEKDGIKETVGYLGEGEAFGGISILMNSGIMLRNVRVNKNVILYVISQKTFLELCAVFDSFYEYFINTYSGRMRDKMYSSVVVTEHARRFISSFVPFSFLPAEEIKKIAPLLSVVDFPQNITLFTQGESKIEHIYILKSGTVKRRRIEENKKTEDIMEAGDIFGGYSILANNCISSQTIETKENVAFYKLPREYFINLCSQFTILNEYFTNTFGEKILKKSYASLISGSIGSEEDSLGFFNNTIGTICNKDLIFCAENDSIQKAASIMSIKKCGSILIKNSEHQFLGIVTDTDFRKKVIAEGYDIKKPIADIMSSPLITVQEHSFIFEALIKSMENNKTHIIVSDTDENIIGIVTHRDMLNAQGKSPFLFIKEISIAQTIERIVEKQQQLPKTIYELITKGAKARHITKFISAISGAILNKLIEFAINDIGKPPVKFTFMIMGSEGRYEQTLKTDQDNAIIFEDVPKENEKDITEYFLKLGDKVCNLLNRVGYSFCKGNIMAKNPKLCGTLSKWKEYFNAWIYKADPDDLLQANIFFDFRKGYGDAELINSLRKFLFQSFANWPGFFRRLAENSLSFKSPLGLFRQFRLETKGEYKNSFDIKRAMLPVVDFARIYALQYSIEETNTHERLYKVYQKNILSREEYKDIDQSYEFMMQLRFVRQVKAIVNEKKEPDNYINPDNLSPLEQKILKEIFKKIEKFQEDSRLRFMKV